jgi:hypothetical protein
VCFGDERRWEREDREARIDEVRRLFDRYRAVARSPRWVDEQRDHEETEQQTPEREPVLH